MDIAEQGGDVVFGFLGQERIMGIPVPILIFALLAALAGHVCCPENSLWFARSMPWAANGQAATFSGIPQGRGWFFLHPT